MKYYSLVALITLYTLTNGCDEYDWRPISPWNIQWAPTTSTTLMTTILRDPITYGVIIESQIAGTGGGGCNAEYHVFAFISDAGPTKWEKIRYTLQFWDYSACWSILGNTHYGAFPPNFESGLIEFDRYDENDKILSNTLFYGSYDGQTIRCDTDTDNFWYSASLPYPDIGSYYGALRVEQRRDENIMDAGIGIGFTCAGPNTKVRISSIEVGYA